MTISEMDIEPLLDTVEEQARMIEAAVYNGETFKCSFHQVVTENKLLRKALELSTARIHKMNRIKYMPEGEELLMEKPEYWIEEAKKKND